MWRPISSWPVTPSESIPIPSAIVKTPSQSTVQSMTGERVTTVRQRASLSRNARSDCLRSVMSRTSTTMSASVLTGEVSAGGVSTPRPDDLDLVSLEELLSDHHALDLGSSLPYQEEGSVAVEPLDLIFLRVAVAAVDAE